MEMGMSAEAPGTDECSYECCTRVHERLGGCLNQDLQDLGDFQDGRGAASRRVLVRAYEECLGALHERSLALNGCLNQDLQDLGDFRDGRGDGNS